MNIPEGVSIQERVSEDTAYYFIMNFTDKIQSILLPENKEIKDLEGNEVHQLQLGTFDVKIVKETK